MVTMNVKESLITVETSACCKLLKPLLLTFAADRGSYHPCRKHSTNIPR